ncbi:phytanoyl-CoA dioxygenase family protein [Flavisolibacter sp. BT320]|nr:phytanoyl-CoA dioxygenase family protein [Flavisolibacter longurius]
MVVPDTVKEKIFHEGFAIVNGIYSTEEVSQILSAIAEADNTGPTFRKSEDLFAIRQFFKEIPATRKLVLNQKLTQLVSAVFGDDYFIVKSIYFDKPGNSNWFVSYHQDLTISVDKKIDCEGYGPWTKKEGQFAVQPPPGILEDNFTIRIHLDDTTEENGALKVIPQSHKKGIYRAENIDWKTEQETICAVSKGGVMFMKPLLFHASNRTTNYSRRRVIHIEFSRCQLDENMNWSEFIPLN